MTVKDAVHIFLKSSIKFNGFLFFLKKCDIDTLCHFSKHAVDITQKVDTSAPTSKFLIRPIRCWSTIIFSKLNILNNNHSNKKLISYENRELQFHLSISCKPQESHNLQI